MGAAVGGSGHTYHSTPSLWVHELWRAGHDEQRTMNNVSQRTAPVLMRPAAGATLVGPTLVRPRW